MPEGIKKHESNALFTTNRNESRLYHNVRPGNYLGITRLDSTNGADTAGRLKLPSVTVPAPPRTSIADHPIFVKRF